MSKVCGECRYYQVIRSDEVGDIGRCGLDVYVDVFRRDRAACKRFAPHPKAKDARLGSGSLRGVATLKSSAASLDQAVEAAAQRARQSLDECTPAQLIESAEVALGAWVPQGGAPLGQDWEAGMLLLCPRDAQLKPKDMPLSQLLRKVVSMREYLRVLEQKLNTHAQLSDEARVGFHSHLFAVHWALGLLAAGWAQMQSPEGAIWQALNEAQWARSVRAAPALGERWCGGQVRYESAEGAVIEEPMGRFFLRLLLLRDRLMRLEEALQQSAVLAGEAESLGAYVLRCYGALTSFNLLFQAREAYFSSGG